LTAGAAGGTVRAVTEGKKRKKKAGASKKKPAKRAAATAPSPEVRSSAPRARRERRVVPPTVWIALGVVALVIGGVIWQVVASDTDIVPEMLTVRVIETHPHDRRAFTQGLVWHDGKIYESTGLRGQSTLRRVDLESGEVEEEKRMPAEIFAEGLALAGDRLIQLTWQNRKAFVYELGSLEKVDEFEYEGEGWGLCYDGERLVMSNGSDRLVFRDPDTFERIGSVRVTLAGQPVRDLNELECVDGEVYANVWQRDEIVRIDPETGRVTASIDASALHPRRERMPGEDVLNGIAYLPERGRFLLTGKNWGNTYEVEFVEAEGAAGEAASHAQNP
jgi:glutaminyl-peptide cyclotransferase